MGKEKRTAWIHGKIFTSDDENLYADAMMIEDGMIQWVGKEEDMPDHEAEIMDLAGKCVIPGFVEGHMHPVILADFNPQISCLPPQVNSIDEMKAAIQERRKTIGNREWIMGWGYDEGKFAEHRAPNRYDLDEGASDVPVSVMRTCGHIRCVNSKALEIMGITKDTPDPIGGKIDRDESGEPTGILRENAKLMVNPYLPEKTEDDVVDELVALGEVLLSQGITSVTDMGLLDDSIAYEIYQKAVQKGWKQKATLYYIWDFYDKDPDFTIPRKHFDPNQQIHVGGVKVIGDGSISGRTAWLNEPYLGSTEDYGMQGATDELIEHALAFAKKNHCQFSIHAMGGRTIDRMIDRVYPEEKWLDGPEPHLRIEHVTEPSEDAMKKAAEKGIAFATQPIFQYCEIESYLKNLGAERTKKTYPYRAMLENGVKICFSSDAPCTSWATPSDPLPGLKCAVTRRAFDGTDCGQEQSVDIETAVKLYTKEGAEIAGLQKVGQLKAGYQADFVILSEDLFEAESEKIDQVKVDATYIAGNCVFCRKEKAL